MQNDVKIMPSGKGLEKIYQSPFISYKLPPVSIITPTIRTGFFNIMAHNIALQTYPNIVEWIIVDDYPEDRGILAKEYGRKYNLGVRYLRGSQGSSYLRRCGLVRANNIGWQKADGELLVWLQDFILIPPNGIESLVDIYRHHPNDLIAPVDIYYNALPANKENREDWWDGKTQILTSKSWTNVRVQNKGITYSENPFDFEMDYGAIPRSVVEELNGWWEFMDSGLGFDNTCIAYRALISGHKLIIDDTNIARCINIWPMVGGTPQNITGRERILNSPRYQWLIKQINLGKLPIVRDEKIDASINLDFTVPKNIKDEDCANWINSHAEEIVKKWGDRNAVS